MPYKSLKEAPIKKLNGAKLTLAQVNQIAKVYDALKAQKGIENPWAAAVAAFKKQYKKVGDKWVKREEEEAAAASAMDLEHLDRYHIVSVGDHDLAEVDDLRELEIECGAGVHALWSDALQSIVAFAFETNYYEMTEAQEWVKEAMRKPTITAEGLMDVLRETFAAVAVWATGAGDGTEDGDDEPGSVGAYSFDELRRMADQALEMLYNPTGGGNYPWIVDMGENEIVFDWSGGRFACPYTVDYATDAITLGSPVPVSQEWVRKTDGATVMLHAFTFHLGDADDDVGDEDDNLIWKEICHPGRWFKMNTGNPVEITIAMIKAAFEAWKDGLPKLIPVPADSHRSGDVPAENNRGFVKTLKLIGEKLFAGFDLTDPTIAYNVSVGNIADVSVFLEPNVVHPGTGKRYPWMLRHVLLTNNPLIQDLEPFGAVPADGTDATHHIVIYRQQEDGTMPNQTGNPGGPQGQGQPDPQGQQGVGLSAADVVTLQAFQGLGISPDDVRAMMAERAAVCARARGLEITRVVRALEGVEEHPGVTQIEGCRHWPVVCAAVEKALKEQPEGLGFEADQEGQTGLDALVLEIVNAIPAEARMALPTENPSSPKARKGEPPPLTPDGDNATEEQIDALMGQIGLAPAA